MNWIFLVTKLSYFFDTISVKGRVKWTDRKLPSLLGQMPIRPFDERSEPEKPMAFLVSARRLRKYEK